MEKKPICKHCLDKVMRGEEEVSLEEALMLKMREQAKRGVDIDILAENSKEALKAEHPHYAERIDQIPLGPVIDAFFDDLRQ